MTDITALVAAMGSNAPDRPQFIPGRYPFTYAYDYVRTHAPDFLAHSGVDESTLMPSGYQGMLWSRSDVAGIVRRYVEATNQDPEKVLVAFADAYLAEGNYEVMAGAIDEALIEARRTSWKSLGYDQPQA